MFVCAASELAVVASQSGYEHVAAAEGHSLFSLCNTQPPPHIQHHHLSFKQHVITTACVCVCVPANCCGRDVTCMPVCPWCLCGSSSQAGRLLQRSHCVGFWCDMLCTCTRSICLAGWAPPHHHQCCKAHIAGNWGNTLELCCRRCPLLCLFAQRRLDTPHRCGVCRLQLQNSSICTP